MSENEYTEEVQEGNAAEETAVESSGPMDVTKALEGVLKKALIHDGLARGIRECAKALDQRQAHLCVLNESNTEAAYVKLIEAFCDQNGISLIKVSDPKVLGQWAGLGKLDRDGVPRKVVGCSVVVVRDFGEDSPERQFLTEYLKSR